MPKTGLSVHAVTLLIILSASAVSAQAPPGRNAADDLNELGEFTLELADRRELASGQPGIVKQTFVREGDSVTKGQLLVELEATVPQASLAVAAKQAENDVDVRFAKVAARVAAAEYKLSVAANENVPNAFTKIELEKLELEQQRSELQIEVAAHEFAVAQLQRDEARAVVDSHQILAPADGMITSCPKKAGEAVQVGEILVELKNPELMRIRGDLPIRFLDRVRRGTKILVEPLTPHPAKAKRQISPDGEVLFVDVEVNPETQTVNFIILVDNSSEVLLAGTFAKVSLIPDEDTQPPETASR